MRDFPQALKLVRERGPSPSVELAFLKSLEVAIQGGLPRDYKLLLEKVGLPLIPGLPEVEFYHPGIICGYAGSIYNYEDRPPAEWPVLPIARLGRHGDDLGLLRNQGVFGPEVVSLDHEYLWRGDPSPWSKREADSVCSFVVHRLLESELQPGA